MPHRQFVDASGALWAVWDVRPSPLRQSDDQDSALARSARARSIADIDNTLSAGWLCFESADQKRRLAPIPSDWDALSVDELIKLCQRAANVRRRGGSDEPTNGNPSAA
jgi:hypothetical protein